MVDDGTRETFWGVELTKDKPEYTWTFEEDDDDQDFLAHTLFVKLCVLGISAVEGERNVIEVETKEGPDGEKKKMAFASLTQGRQDMCNMDISFGHEVPVTFKLTQGTGPITLVGQHMIEFPDDASAYNSQDETYAEDETEEDEEEDEDEEDLEDEELSPMKSSKRKAEKPIEKKAKKVKLTESTSSAGEGDDQEEDSDEEDEDNSIEEMEESPVKEDKKKKKGKVEVKAKKTLKTTKKSPKVSKVAKRTGKVSKK